MLRLCVTFAPQCERRCDGVFGAVREARKLPLRNTLLPPSWPKSERRPCRGGRGRLRGGRHRGVPMAGGMELDRVTFATITWARTDEEDRALRTSLGVLSG